jgi:hypothetical protein
MFTVRRLLLTSVAGSAAGVSYYYRPIGDNEPNSSKGPKRSGITLSKEGLCDRANIPPPMLYSLASAMVIFVTTTVGRIFIYCGGNFKVVEDDNYSHFLSLITKRESGVPLITVSVRFFLDVSCCRRYSFRSH